MKEGDSTFKLIHNWVGTPSEATLKFKELYNHYYPMESDPKVSEKENALMFKEWFTKDFSTMASCGYSPSDFVTMVRDSRLLFRRGTAEMFLLA